LRALAPNTTQSNHTTSHTHFKEDPGIENAVSELGKKGVRFESYGLPGQDERGIWTAPGGARVVWFRDPDGNVLSVSQHV
jgi:catechol 2,3-dioxygenase-like lactoylglutathione lyase family enzyme